MVNDGVIVRDKIARVIGELEDGRFVAEDNLRRVGSSDVRSTAPEVGNRIATTARKGRRRLGVAEIPTS